MQENDTPGVIVPNNIVIPSLDRILPTEEINIVKPAFKCVQNYPLEHVRRSMDKVVNNPDYPQFSSIIPAGMTQQSNVNNQAYSSQSDDEHFTLQDDGDYERRLWENLENAHVFDDAHSFAKFLMHAIIWIVLTTRCISTSKWMNSWIVLSMIPFTKPKWKAGSTLSQK